MSNRQKLMYALLTFLLGYGQVFGQIKTVNYDPYDDKLNGKNPLPAEELFFIKGMLPKDVLLVTLKIGKTGRKESKMSEYSWKKPYGIEINQFEIFVSQPLYANDGYDLQLSFFKRVNEDQLMKIENQIQQSLEAYVRANLEVSGRGIRSNHSNLVMIRQMDEIVRDALQDYKHFLGKDFPGFSDIVLQKLEQKDGLDLKNAKYSLFGDEKPDEKKVLYAQQFLSELVNIATGEAAQYLNNNLLTLVDIRDIQNFPTEKMPVTIPLNFGYGTVWYSDPPLDRQFLHGAFAGISIPLANKTFNRILGNTSFSTGVFIRSFEASDGTPINGSFIDVPFYVGLGYRMFRVFRINFGGVALDSVGGQNGFSITNIEPYAGVSLEFKLWMGFNDKR